MPTSPSLPKLFVPALAGCALLLMAASAGAVLPGARTGYGLAGGMIKLHEGEWDYSTVDRLAGLSLVRELNPNWRLQLALRNGRVSAGVAEPGQDAGWTRDSKQPFTTILTQPMVGVDYRFSPTRAVSPYVGAGLGLTAWTVVSSPDGEPGWFATGEAITGYDIDGQAAALSGTELTLEVRLGVAWRLSSRFELGARAAYQVMQGNDRDDIGLSSIWGSDHVDANRAAATALMGLTWWVGDRDGDGDGVPDDQDLCPDQAEDRDGFNDLDGCPDPDNDGDGILDADDACPRLPEDFDGYQDEDGCPDLDNDGDGIRDGNDRCPDEAEDLDGFEDQDGCPDPDNDQDGVPDVRDKCPFTQRGTPVDADGCPLSGAGR